MTEEQIDRFLKSEQKETEASLWGTKVKFKPYLLEKIFGDGMKLIYFGTLDDRPYWWLVRVDSNADIKDPRNFNHEEIYSAIEEECGGWIPDKDAEVDEDGYDEEGTCHRGEYPMIISDSYEHWGLIADLAKGTDKYGCPIRITEDQPK